MMRKLIIGTGCVVSICQTYSIYNYGLFYDKVIELRIKRGIVNQNDFIILNRLCRNTGFFPFTLVSSLYYGTNRIKIIKNNGLIPKVIIMYDKDFFEFVEKTYKNYNFKDTSEQIEDSEKN